VIQDARSGTKALPSVLVSHERDRPRPASLGVWFTCIGLILLSGGCGSPAPSTPDGAESPPPLPAPVAKGMPLNSGENLPALTAEGWLNGSPPTSYGPEVRLVVVDIWAQWCPYCRFSAPELVRAYRKFGSRGVAFVSLTTMSRQSAESFVSEFSLPWPNGYGAPAATIAALGVTSGMPMPEYLIAPTVYLVDRDNRVVWSDNQGRFRHTEAKAWGKQLDEAIEAGLAKDPPMKK
jgi:thiol-disulfide isomerase/thioredoxin